MARSTWPHSAHITIAPTHQLGIPLDVAELAGLVVAHDHRHDDTTLELIDLLLFHRRLRCLVAIELKVGEFQPEFVGKMQFYLTALDRQVREESEKPSIGIILCKEKNRTVVEYTLHDARKPMGVATYHISKQLPEELKGQLPSPQEIARLLEIVE